MCQWATVSLGSAHRLLIKLADFVAKWVFRTYCMVEISVAARPHGIHREDMLRSRHDDDCERVSDRDCVSIHFEY
jgi:hypothetical protein